MIAKLVETTMLVAGQAHTVRPGEGQIADMGAVQMRTLVASESLADQAFAFTEFTGTEGAWTVPHIHRATEESFFVLEGQFTFTVGEETLEVGPGSYLLVPRGSRHMIHAGQGGGKLLALIVPGGLERMFVELAQLPPGGITDPAVRAAISARYDSVPV